jgi:hypothetical protein
VLSIVKTGYETNDDTNGNLAQWMVRRQTRPNADREYRAFSEVTGQRQLFTKPTSSPISTRWLSHVLTDEARLGEMSRCTRVMNLSLVFPLLIPAIRHESA